MPTPTTDTAQTTPPAVAIADPAPIQTPEAWGTADAPPTSFQIFKMGQNHATVGGRREVFTLTPKGCAAIVAEWKRRRISGAMDYEHAVRDSNPSGTPAAGWFNIEARPSGLWAVNVRWTERALNYFKAKEYRYFSPLFFANKRGEIETFFNLALTNWPATDQQRPLIALSALSWALRSYNTMSPDQAIAKAKEIIAACEGKEEFADKVALLLMSEGPMPTEEMPPLTEVEMGAPMEDETQMVAQAAYTATGMKGRACVGALQQLSTIRAAHDKAVAELRQIKHTAAVDAAIKERKLTPAKRAEALAMDPEIFRGWTSLASPVVDDTTYTAKTAEPVNAVTVEALKTDAKFIAHCNKVGTDLELAAQNWVRKYPGIPFEG